MTDNWKTRCDNNHLGHFLMDYMRKIPNEIHQSSSVALRFAVIHYKDVLKRHLKKCGIHPSRWEQQAAMRPEWRAVVKSKVYDFENQRRIELDTKRDHVKARPPVAELYNYVNGVLTCPQCSRSFINKIDAATGQEETCASVLSRTIRLAQCFGKLGLVPGDPIVVGGRNHLDVHIPFYAGMMSGLPVAGVDPALKSTELKHLLRIVKPKVAFCEYAMLEEYQQAVQELSLDTEIVTFCGGENSLAKFMNAQQDLPSEEEFQVATFNTDEVYCWLTSTSGSTGRPKVVALTHSHIRQISDFFIPANKNGLRKPALNLATLHWASGCYNALLMPMNNIKVQTSGPATTEHVIDIINKYKPAGTVCTPTFLAPLLHHKTSCDLTCFDVVNIGGSKVHRELLMGLRARLREDTVIMQGYGQTEVGSAVLLAPAGEPYGNMGTMDPRYKAKLISPDTGKEILEPNVTGELLLKGPVMAGYYNNPTATKEVFTDDGYIKTGDLFYKDENGLYYFVERLKMLLKYKNYQIVPPDVEEVILTHDGVADVCVTGIPHPDDGEHVVACVVRQQGSKVTAQEIKDLVSKHLSASKHLHGGVVFLDALPTTPAGKVARMEVKKLVLTAHRE